MGKNAEVQVRILVEDSPLGVRIRADISRNSFEGELKYEGTNEIGPQMDIDLFRVVFKPGKSLNPISDEWGNIEIEGGARSPMHSESSEPGRCENRLSVRKVLQVEPKGITCEQMIRLLLAAAVAIFGASIGASDLQAAGDAVRGRQITEKSCVRCHSVAGARNPTAPAFSAIVRRSGRNDDYLRGFLEDDHFPMVMHSLIESDKEDVLAYFRSLRTKR